MTHYLHRAGIDKVVALAACPKDPNDEGEGKSPRARSAVATADGSKVQAEHAAEMTRCMPIAKHGMKPQTNALRRHARA
jgi:hypothetical protein